MSADDQERLRRSILVEQAHSSPPDGSRERGWKRFEVAMNAEHHRRENSDQSANTVRFLIVDNILLTIAETAGALALASCLFIAFDFAHVGAACLIATTFLAVASALPWAWCENHLRPLVAGSSRATHRHFAAHAAHRVMREYFRLTWLLPLLGVLAYVAWGLVLGLDSAEFFWLAIPAVIYNGQFMLRLWGSEPGRSILVLLSADRGGSEPKEMEELAQLVYVPGETRVDVTSRMMRVHNRFVAWIERMGARDHGVGGIHEILQNVFFVALAVGIVSGNFVFGTEATLFQVGLLATSGMCHVASQVMRILHSTRLFPRWLAIRSTPWCLIARVRPKPVAMSRAIHRELTQWISAVQPWSALSSDDCTLSYHPPLHTIGARSLERESTPENDPPPPRELKRRSANDGR